MGFVAVPQPYDFAVSLDRFTFWGVDRANVWHDGGLHRVIDGGEVRITEAPGGVNAEPLDETIEPTVRHLLGVELDLMPTGARDLILAGAILSILCNPLLFAALDRWQRRRDLAEAEKKAVIASGPPALVRTDPEVQRAYLGYASEDEEVPA